MTLIWGTANPEGMKDSYRGVYLNESDVTNIIGQINEARDKGDPIPVKIEHTGQPVGRVLRAFDNHGKLDCFLELNERVLEGSIGAEFIRRNIIKDLSLGYTLDLKQSKASGTWISNKKKLNEISIVKAGARNKCHIHGFTMGGKTDG